MFLLSKIVDFHDNDTCVLIGMHVTRFLGEVRLAGQTDGRTG